MFNKKIKPDDFRDWKCVYETSVESEAGLVSAYLKDCGIDCEILSKKDTAYNVNFGDLSAMYLYVPIDQAKEAQNALQEWKEGKIYEEGDEDSQDEDSQDNDLES